jgi:hypothetical protein
LRFVPLKAAGRHATLFEEFAGTARAEVVSTQLLLEKFVTMDNPNPAFHVCFGPRNGARRRPTQNIVSTPIARAARTAPPFAHRLKRTPVRSSHGTAWHTSKAHLMDNAVTFEHRLADTGYIHQVRLIQSPG